MLLVSVFGLTAWTHGLFVAVGPPVNTVAPSFTGNQVKGQVLSSNNGTWTQSPTSYTYQWKRGGVAIPGAIELNYQLVNADIGSTISVAVTAINAAGSATASSGSSGAIVEATPNVTGTFNVTPAGNSILDSFPNGVGWSMGSTPTATNPIVITYSFPQNANSFCDNTGNSTAYGNHENTTGFSGLSAQQQAVAEKTLALWARLTNITFVKITEPSPCTVSSSPIPYKGANIRFGNSSVPATSYAYSTTSYPQPDTGDIWFGTSDPQNVSPTFGDYGWYVFMHEEGHTLGLKHYFDVIVPNWPALLAAYQTTEWGIMDYASFVTPGGGNVPYTNAAGSGPQSPMYQDIMGIQLIYGVDTRSNSGATSYSWNATTGELSINGVASGNVSSTHKIYMTIWDGAFPNDTYDFSAFPHGGSTINLGLSPITPPPVCSIANSSLLADQGSGHTAACNVYNSQNANSTIEHGILPP